MVVRVVRGWAGGGVELMVVGVVLSRMRVSEGGWVLRMVASLTFEYGFI